MSTDMAISLAKKFIRQISQPFDHTQTGISLWKLEDIEEKQRKEKEEADRAIGSLANGGGFIGGDDAPEIDMGGINGFDTGDVDVNEKEASGPPPQVRDVEMDLEYGEIDDAALMDLPMEDM